MSHRRHHHHHGQGGWVFLALILAMIVAGWVIKATGSGAIGMITFFAIFAGLLWLMLHPQRRSGGRRGSSRR